MRRACCSIAFLLAACESTPYPASVGAGDAIVVELLDAHFVRVDGRRRPWEDWIYDMREVCRAADSAAPMPWVRFQLVGADVPARAVERLQHELRATGVARIELEGR